MEPKPPFFIFIMMLQQSIFFYLVALWNDICKQMSSAVFKYPSLLFNLKSQVKKLFVLLISKQISQIHIFIFEKCARPNCLLTLRFQKDVASHIDLEFLVISNGTPKEHWLYITRYLMFKTEKNILVQLRNLIYVGDFTSIQVIHLR